MTNAANTNAANTNAALAALENLKLALDACREANCDFAIETEDDNGTSLLALDGVSLSTKADGSPVVIFTQNSEYDDSPATHVEGSWGEI